MKKNKMMRFASMLLVLTLLSTCAISGTFAKYTTEVNSEDSARVANWGFDATTLDISGLFDKAYVDEVVKSAKTDGSDTAVLSSVDVIAPGTKNSVTFGFAYNGNENVAAPEVDYSFNITPVVTGNTTSLDSNPNFFWTVKMPGETNATKCDNVAALNTALTKLNGNYTANTLPKGFADKSTNDITVGWEWTFETAGENAKTQDATDTGMGNADDLADIKIVLTINATQLDKAATSVVNPNA